MEYIGQGRALPRREKYSIFYGHFIFLEDVKIFVL